MANIINLGEDGDFKPYTEIIAEPKEWTHHEGEWRICGSEEWIPAIISILWDEEGKAFEEIQIEKISDDMTCGEICEKTKTKEDIKQETLIQNFVNARKEAELQIKNVVLNYLEALFEMRKEEWEYDLEGIKLYNQVCKDIEEEMENLVSLTFEDYEKDFLRLYDKIIKPAKFHF